MRSSYTNQPYVTTLWSCSTSIFSRMRRNARSNEVPRARTPRSELQYMAYQSTTSLGRVIILKHLNLTRTS